MIWLSSKYAKLTIIITIFYRSIFKSCKVQYNEIENYEENFNME